MPEALTAHVIVLRHEHISVTERDRSAIDRVE